MRRKKRRKKRIVCLGGGNAMPKAVLTGLKKYDVYLSVISATLDTGGSSGRLRKDYKIIAPGDLRRAFIALANTSPVIEELFNFRFQTGELKGHNFANLFIAALELSTNDYEKSFLEVKKLLNVPHEVLPVTLSNSNLYAILDNGRIVSGETNIDIPKGQSKSRKIKRVFLKPKSVAYPKALQAIRKADLIVIGPGDLYSSLAQIFLTKGIPEAIKKSKAKTAYVCNLMTKRGETDNFSVSDFVKEVEKYLSLKLDYIIYNNFFPKKSDWRKYKKKHPELLEPVKIDEGIDKDKRFIGANLLKKKTVIEHHPKKLSQLIISLLNK